MHLEWNICQSGTRRIISLGSNTHGQLGRIPSNDVEPLDNTVVEYPDAIKAWNLEKIVCGSEHVNLGLGTADDAHVPVKVSPSKHGDPYNIINMWAGCISLWICLTVVCLIAASLRQRSVIDFGGLSGGRAFFASL